MLVSVICPNHGRDLTKLVESLPSGVEFIEVNLGLERSAQRNIGIERAKGEYLLILDSDQTVSPGLIEECQKMALFGFDALYIPEIIVGCRLFTRIRAFERTFYTGTPVDVPRFIRRKTCPLFDETMSGPEDADWGNRIWGVKGITKNALYHYDDISFFEYFRKKSYYSKSMKRYAEKWPNDPCLNLKYRCWTVFTEKGKWKKLLRHPFLSLGIVFVLLVRGIIYVTQR